MITQQTLPLLLKHLNFLQNGHLWSKTIGKAILQVDFDKKQLIYPENEGLIVNERQTCNFSDNENFVVFECVHRLLQKGYLPHHIELEKRWQLGHLQKSGRADICVYQNDDKTAILMMIECKTYGKEYKKALELLKDDGGQLFSYWQQDHSTQWLSLYASSVEQDKVIYKNDIVFCQDDKNTRLLAQTDPSVALYQNATNKQALHKVWTDTYGSHLYTGLIFGDDSTAYQIGVKPLRIKDLIPFNPDDKLINQFEEILRHNAVSDKENAFNRLIALFICKLVDETDKEPNSEVDFQYKTTKDSYESLQDRLQRLYRDGMGKFMGEEIFYVADDFADDVFHRYQGGDRKNAINELKDTIKKLKFYTNGDFAFKEIHNRELFLQNGKILVEMVQLFEKYKIVYNNKDQFLGDLFEQLLNKGFKQNEGQFFTPQPITRFIWDSLPICQQNDYPKVIDYACGSGHFLTEAVEAINAHRPSDNNDWTADSIFGIEKDYRLARVSKVSMFMNGAGKSNIIFGDGLDNHEKIDNEQFDILVANPPYSVKKFKSHLGLKNNDFDLLEYISNDSGEIEVLFCERIKQLLKSEGVAAVILPSSILSNDSTSYTAARTLLLHHFYIRAIVNLGSKTFGATGTNTVILFLEKFKYPPTRFGEACDIANSIFNNDDLTAWADGVVYERYLKTIGTPKAVYDKLRKNQMSFDELTAIDDEYIALQRQHILDKITLNKTEIKLPIDKQNALRLIKFWQLFSEKEQEKLQIFALTYDQKTLIINAPSDNAAQKHFLGYDWSNRKGNEGIQIINAGGLLYKADDRFADNTLASHIRQMFSDKTTQIGEPLKDYAYLMDSSDMIAFDLASFNKAIKTSLQKKIEINSKYPLKKIDDIITTIETGNRPKGGVGVITSGAYSLGGEHIGKNNGRLELKTIKYVPMEFFENSNRGKIQKNDILLCKDGALTGKIAIVRNELDNIQAMVNEHVFILRCENLNTQLYVFNYLYSEYGQLLLKDNITGSAQGGLNATNLKNIKIPLPPLPIQQQIVDECEKIDQEYENSRMAIETYRQKIAQIFEELEVMYLAGGGRLVKIGEICFIKGGKRVPKGFNLLSTPTPYPYIRVSDFYQGGVITKDIKYITFDVYKHIKNYTISTEDIFISIAGTIGLCGIVPSELNNANLTENAAKLQIKDKNAVNQLYLMHCLNSQKIQQEFKNQTHTLGVPKLALSRIAEVSVPLPPITIQTQIIAQIEALENQIKAAQAVMDTASEQKKAVLDGYLN